MYMTLFFIISAKYMPLFFQDVISIMRYRLRGMISFTARFARLTASKARSQHLA
jgi:hypothetical protein